MTLRRFQRFASPLHSSELHAYFLPRRVLRHPAIELRARSSWERSGWTWLIKPRSSVYKRRIAGVRLARRIVCLILMLAKMTTTTALNLTLNEKGTLPHPFRKFK
ncbi:hypothetical protein Plhal710r2_c003g0015981 [Plasmopara halstedii]